MTSTPAPAEIETTDASGDSEPTKSDPKVLEGLEPLVPVGVVFVKQNMDILETGTGTGAKQDNHYAIFDQNGKLLYIVDEQSGSCCRDCNGPKDHSRSFTANVTDLNGNGILCHRPRKCCLDSMAVASLFDGQLLGTIKQKCSCCSGSKFKILDDSGKAVLTIKPQADTCCQFQYQFDVFSTAEPKSPVGKIAKQSTEWGQNADADNFGVSFPVDLAVNLKAVLLGAAILIDFAFLKQR